MKQHPSTPADESDLRLHLARQTDRPIELYDILTLGLPPDKAYAKLEELTRNGPKIVLFDVLHQEQLKRIGALIELYGNEGSPLFSVGSSSVEEALAAHWVAAGELTPLSQGLEPGRSTPLLVLSGSCSPVTESQIKSALSHGFADVPLDAILLAKGKETGAVEAQAAEATIKHIRSGRNVIVHTALGASDPRPQSAAQILAERDASAGHGQSAQLFGNAMAQVIREVLPRTGIRRVLLAGGDTAGYAARALGIEALEMLAPLTPGAPLCRADAPNSPADGLEICFKGGQIGPVDFFQKVSGNRKHEN